MNNGSNMSPYGGSLVGVGGRNRIKKAVFGGLIVAMVLFLAAPAVYAGAPLLSVAKEGSGDNVRITISNANPYSQITLYRRQGTQLWTSITNFGQTDGSGFYSTTVSLGSDGSNNSVEQYVVIGGMQSSIVSTYPYGGGGGCYGSNCGNYGNISFSENNTGLNAGQSRTINIYGSSGNIYGNYYISSNSNSSVVSASISGNSLNLYGRASGYSSITVCQNNNSNCGSIFVNVGGSVAGTNTGSITFSPSSVNMSTGQNTTVRISVPYPYSGGFYVSSNSNSNVVSAYISGNTLNLNGGNSGNSNITVCQSGGGNCGSVFVSVGGGGNSGNLSFSTRNPNLSVGQSLNIYIYGGNSSGGYYIPNHGNSNVVSASITGNTLYLRGINNGNSNITICQSGASVCDTIFVTVGGGGGGTYYGNLNLSQTNLNLPAGQSAAITIYGGYGNFYISNNTNSNVASGSISGDKVNIYGYTSGSTTMSVCSSNATSCVSLYVTVGGNIGGDIRIINTNLPSMTVGQFYSVELQASGGVPPYTFSMNSGGVPAGLSLSNSGLLSGTPQYAIAANFGIRVQDSRGRSGSAFFNVSPQGSSGGGVLGTSTYKNGQLLNESGTVYIVYKNTKTGFASLSAFRGLGFDLNDVSQVGATGLVDSGFIVTTLNAAHPWGSWVKSGQTVYFVHELGLIPVPNMSTFFNNGGEERFIVPANSFDFRLPIFSPMTLNDSRMR